MPADRRRILVLGGTVEARALANRLVEAERHDVITSFAGRTTERIAPQGEVRVGGFGGAEGLGAFLGKEKIALVADAAHPFAATISAHAVEACKQAGIPCLRLERPGWTPEAGDSWTMVKDIEAAVEEILPGSTAFVTAGRQQIGPFFARGDIRVVARMIERPSVPVPANAEIILARPPFALQDETALMWKKGIGVLVAKNSGGGATRAKLDAARELAIPVIMIERPAKPPCKTASDVDQMMTEIESSLG